MANIVENLRKILTSRYGRDVRQAIHDSISDINDIAEGQEAAILAHTREAEAWAKGTKDGVDVPSTDPTYHDNAKYYSGIGDNFRKLAEAWAKGTVDSVDVESGEDGYHDNAEYYKTLAEYAMDQAEHFYQETLAISQRLGNALVPKGTVTFANLPSVSSSAILDGFMYNISDAFTTTSDFVEGAGYNIPAGANIYKITVNNVSKWDVLPGTGATVFNGTQQTVADAMQQGLLTEGMLVNIIDDDANGEAVTALQVEYDDTNTELDETTAQGAIEKLKTMIAGLITELGNSSSASTVTGADAFSKINSLHTAISGKQDALTDPLVQTDIVNNLTSTATNKPLSAAQGKSLKDSMSGIGSYYTQEKKFATSGATTLSNTFTNIPKGVYIGHLYFYGFAGTEGGFLNIYTGNPTNCTCVFAAWAGGDTREMSVPINIICPNGGGSLPVNLYIGNSWQGTANIGLGLHLTKIGNVS